MRLLRRAVALALAVVLPLAACSGDPADDADADAEPSAAEPPPTTDPATAEAWVRIDQGLADLAPQVGFLAAQVTDDGTCAPVHEIDPSTPHPTASQFKLFVLGAVAERIAAGDIAWDDTMTVRAEDQSLGNAEGSLQAVAPGTTVSVEEAATKMISISDNTAADMLIGLAGRDRVEARSHEWVADAAANEPFLTTRQMFLLHYVPDLADRYLATPQDGRADFLADSVDPLPFTDIEPDLLGEPRHIETVEWFASPEDVCRAFAGLQELATDPALAPLPAVLSREVGTLGLDRSAWPTIWYKGGSEPGVLTMGWLATTDRGDTFVVEAMVANPDVALADDAITDLVALAEEAFGLLG